jgi:hypothetical protein
MYNKEEFIFDIIPYSLMKSTYSFFPHFSTSNSSSSIAEEKDDSRELKSMCSPCFTNTKEGW